MFDHVTIRVREREESARFYDTVLGVLGIPAGDVGDAFTEWDDFSIAQADGDRPPTSGLHIGFVAPTREHVDAFWRAGTDAGYASDGEPGERPEYTADYYGAFLLDPDGNSAEAVHHSDVRPGNWIDHLWIGVENLDRAAAFYGALGPHLGIRRGASQGSRRPFRGAFATFSLVADGRAPTRNLHMAFPAPNRRTVDGFHAGALAAGYRTNGAPGERPDYHPGYYGAFVLDPDGTNVESVYHGRG